MGAKRRLYNILPARLADSATWLAALCKPGKDKGLAAQAREAPAAVLPMARPLPEPPDGPSPLDLPPLWVWCQAAEGAAVRARAEGVQL